MDVELIARPTHVEFVQLATNSRFVLRSRLLVARAYVLEDDRPVDVSDGPVNHLVELVEFLLIDAGRSRDWRDAT